VTPDRNDQTPEDDIENGIFAENGVLAETGAIDTTGLGILAGSTEQVSVDVPLTVVAEELDDDDVLGDEVSVFEILGVDESVARLEAVDYTVETDYHSIEQGGTASTEEPVFEHNGLEQDGFENSAFEHSGFENSGFERNGPGHDRVEHSGLEHSELEHSGLDHNGLEHDGPEHNDPASFEQVSSYDIVESPVYAEDEDESVETADVIDEFDDVDEAQPDITESTVEAEIVTEQHTPDAHDDAAEGAQGAASVPASDSGVVPTTTGANPATRRAAHADAVDRTGVQAVERIQPRTDVTLTSKRLGEFEHGRESADLLTADRLLDPHQVVRPEPEGAWQHFVYSITAHRVNLGDGKRARARKELDRRISAGLGVGARFVPVLSRKGGVGKTTITTLLGMALADARDDRIIAVDANPDRGTLADRIARQDGKTVRDLARARGEIAGYAGISSIVARDDTRLDVLASDSDPRVSEAFSDRDYNDVAAIAAHYYSIVLTDTGTGIVHSVMQATLEMADQLVIVSGLSVEEARLASETLTWLETNGYAEQVRSAVVVLNNARPGMPLVRMDELETHFATRVRSVVRMPYDPHIAAGSAIAFRDLRPETRLAARELAAEVVEGLRALAPAA
jgi:MinD-like ATPase involved in chromosome partitioning or flagellar assembly